MTEIADFKMFEKAPYELPDPNALVEACMVAFREEAKFYGEAYIPRFIKYTLEFLSNKIEVTEDITNLDQLTKYLVSISDKYPVPSNAISYAGWKIENFFEGQLGVGIRVGTTSTSKSMVNKKVIEERNVNIEGVISQYRQTTVQGKVAQKEMGYKRNDDGSIDIIWPNCYLWDACKLGLDEGILKRAGSGLQCGSCQFVCQLAKLITGYEWDYTLLELGESHCITKFYML